METLTIKEAYRVMVAIQVILILIVLILPGCNTGEEEIYLIPKNYVGAVYVIFNQTNGSKPKYAGSSRVYEIPTNGILRTQFSFNEGWHGIPKYYYIDGKNLKPISYQIENKNLVNTLQVCCIQSGTSYKDNDKAVQFERFLIGTKQQIDSIYKIEENRDISQYGE